MDILGKEGEEAKENVQQVSQQLSNLESHLNAVDTALQDFMQSSDMLGQKAMQFEEDELQELGQVEQEVKEVRESEETDQEDIERLEEKIETLQSQVQQMAKVQLKNKKRIQSIMDSELLEIIGRIRKLINTTNKRYYDLRDSIDNLEQRLNELENDFVMEVNTRDYDFEKKVDQNDYEMRNQDIKNELAKLRASVNVLADEMDKKDDIEVN
jgi:chromosome segregation ATPase